jgi:hypothetical protein
MRSCVVCGPSLEGRRSDARHCGSPCRAESSLVRRILAGSDRVPYRSLHERRKKYRRLIAEILRLGSTSRLIREELTQTASVCVIARSVPLLWHNGWRSSYPMDDAIAATGCLTSTARYSATCGQRDQSRGEQVPLLRQVPAL